MIAGVVLAAGSGLALRLAPSSWPSWTAIPLLEHALRAVEAVPAIERIVVVLGARADEIRAGVDFGSAEVVVCEDWADGPGGVAALRHRGGAPTPTRSC